MVGGAVGADQAAAIQGEQDRQVLDRHVVYQLVVGALQKGRIDRDHRMHAFGGHAGGQGHGVLFGDADVEVPVRVALCEFDHSGAFAHRWRDRGEPFVAFGGLAQPVAENLGIAGLAARLLERELAGHGIELGDAVIFDRVRLGGVETLALDREHMQQLRAANTLESLEGRQQAGQIMPVHRAVIVEAQRAEHRTRRVQVHVVDFAFRAGFVRKRTPRTQAVRGIEPELFGDARGVVAHRAHVLRNRHVVVVVDHEHVEAEMADVIERLEGHAGGHAAVSDHGDGAAVVAAHLRRGGDAGGGRQRGAGVAGTKHVVFRFGAVRERCQPAEAADRFQT